MTTYSIITDHPIAVNSPDHLHPLGTRLDSSIRLEFNNRLREWHRPPPRLLDLGCAGGGLVASLLSQGHVAIGVEGSDYSLVRQRDAWNYCPGNLFTADLTKPFRLMEDGQPMRFECITLWEVLEHIAEEDLAMLFANIDDHLLPGGIVLASINTWPSPWDGVELHLSQHEHPWWTEKLDDLGWARNTELEAFFAGTWVRQESGAFHVALERLQIE